MHKSDKAADDERRAWNILCTKLEAAGAVTALDLIANKPKTSGGRLLKAIHAWGAARVALAKVWE